MMRLLFRMKKGKAYQAKQDKVACIPGIFYESMLLLSFTANE